MEYVKHMVPKEGCDVGWHSSNIHPKDREGCVGKAGIDKSYTIDMVIQLAYRTQPRPNILIKTGPKAKWYMKQIDLTELDAKIQSQKWREDQTKNYIMYVIEWND